MVVSPDLFWKDKAKEFATILDCDTIALNKQRNRKTGKIVIKSDNLHLGDFQDVILLDDMVSSGGSMLKAIKFLKKKKIGKTYVVCTHAVFAGNAEKMLKKAGISKIISTNTISGKHSLVDLSGIISETIKKW